MRRATVISILVLVIAGCSDNSGSATRDTISEKPSTVVVVVAEEHRFVPATVSTRGATELRLDNVGALAHNWTVLAVPIKSETDLNRDIVLARAETEPGQSSTVGLDELASGTYQVVCSIPGHFSAGMVGTLVIRGT
jgi:plastocyanin